MSNIHNTPITVAYGDGIGPEIMEAVLKILTKAGARIKVETIEVGEKLYVKGYNSGIDKTTWDILDRTKVFLKAPITTPQGGGYKSLNVTMRKRLNLYANVRPCVSYHPFIKTNHPKLNLTIVRENSEDLYAGIEHRQTGDVYQTIKLTSNTGTERIIRYAFEYAVANNRKKITCMSKDNIMKFTDGIMHKIFNEVANEYPDLKTEHMIIDIGSAKLANSPENFDVVVTSNLYGDIISDIVAECSGSVGLAGSANIGDKYAMFEAVHGSAPDIAGKNIANPSGLLNAAIMMLIHIGQPDIASKIRNAWLFTLEEGLHTRDIYQEKLSKKKLSTSEFADAVIDNLGKLPNTFKKEEFGAKKDQRNNKKQKLTISSKPHKKILVGIDIFINWVNKNGILELSDLINNNIKGELQLQMISCMGLAVWPVLCEDAIENRDHFCLRCVPNNKTKETSKEAILKLVNELNNLNIDFIKTENLYIFNDNELGFSLAQGE